MPLDSCSHCWSAWTTERREINHETDPVMVLQHVCYACGMVEEA